MPGDKQTSNKEWEAFETAICSHFESLGADAKTKHTIKGVRSDHDVDVFVNARFFGQQITWIIEAKYWKTKVPKEKVEVLKGIVNEVGADRGFLISEKGFQKGAHDAAKKTNISLITFDQLKAQTRGLIESEILKNYHDRIELIDARYWTHSKQVRRDYGLRGDRGELDIHYSIPFVLNTAVRAITDALKKDYPISLKTHIHETHGEIEAETFQELVNWLNINLNVADKKILEAEIRMQKDGNFNPQFRDLKGSSFYIDMWKSKIKNHSINEEN
jgi:hypothetical protein